MGGVPRRWGGRRGVLLPVVLVAVVLTTLVGCSTSPAAPTRGDESAATEPTRPTAGATTTDCAPSPALVDPEATEEARCLAARLDEWQASGALGVGQQLNTSGRTFLAPLEELAALPRTVARCFWPAMPFSPPHRIWPMWASSRLRTSRRSPM